MVFVIYDENHEISDFVTGKPSEHTDRFFEMDHDEAARIAQKVVFADDYNVVHDENHRIVRVSQGITALDKGRYADLRPLGLAQLLLAATENLDEAKKEIKEVYQAQVTLRRLRQKYLHF